MRREAWGVSTRSGRVRYDEVRRRELILAGDLVVENEDVRLRGLFARGARGMLDMGMPGGKRRVVMWGIRDAMQGLICERVGRFWTGKRGNMARRQWLAVA